MLSYGDPRHLEQSFLLDALAILEGAAMIQRHQS